MDVGAVPYNLGHPNQQYFSLYPLLWAEKFFESMINHEFSRLIDFKQKACSFGKKLFVRAKEALTQLMCEHYNDWETNVAQPSRWWCSPVRENERGNEKRIVTVQKKQKKWITVTYKMSAIVNKVYLATSLCAV